MSPSRGPSPPRPSHAGSAALPSREALAAHIAEAGETDLSELARVFGVKGADRRALRALLKDLSEEGGVTRRGRKGVASPGWLPPVGVADVVERDVDGELYVRLTKAGDDTPATRAARARQGWATACW